MSTQQKSSKKSTPANASSTTPAVEASAPVANETYLVQNPLLGPIYLTDLKLSWEPGEVKDLMWEDPELLGRSKDLANALKKGLLRRVTDEEYSTILDYEAERDRQEMFAHATMQQNRRRQRDDDGADTFDVLSPRSQAGQAVSTYGLINDPTTFAAAYSVYEAQCRASGQVPNAVQFGEMVKAQPGLLQGYLKRASMLPSNLPGSVSGDPNRGRATVAVAPTDIRQGTSHAHVRMTNFQRDDVLAGAHLLGIDTFPSADDEMHHIPGSSEIDLDPGLGDEINLDLD